MCLRALVIQRLFFPARRQGNRLPPGNNRLLELDEAAAAPADIAWPMPDWLRTWSDEKKYSDPDQTGEFLSNKRDRDLIQTTFPGFLTIWRTDDGLGSRPFWQARLSMRKNALCDEADVLLGAFNSATPPAAFTAMIAVRSSGPPTPGNPPTALRRRPP